MISVFIILDFVLPYLPTASFLDILLFPGSYLQQVEKILHRYTLPFINKYPPWTLLIFFFNFSTFSVLRVYFCNEACLLCWCKIFTISNFNKYLSYLKLYNILVFKENKKLEQKCYILHQIRVKIAEYDFKMQKFIILNQNQKFYNSPKIAEFFKNISFSPKSA